MDCDKQVLACNTIPLGLPPRPLAVHVDQNQLACLAKGQSYSCPPAMAAQVKV